MPNTHFVAAPSAVMLHGGRPAAPGDHVTADPERDRALLASGALLPLEDERTGAAPRRRAKATSVPEPAAPASPTTTS